MKCIYLYIIALVLSAINAIGCTAKENPCFELLKRGDVRKIRECIESGRLRVNDKSLRGKPAVFFAIEHNSRALFDLFVEKGVDLNIEDSKGRTPLMWAAKNEKQDIVVFLLQQKGVAKRIMDKDGYTARTHAGNETIRKILEDYGIPKGTDWFPD